MDDVSGPSCGGPTPCGRRQLPIAVNIRRVAKNQRDDGQTLNGFRADGFQAGNTVQAGFQRRGHQLFRFLGRKPRRLGLNDDFRRGEFGKDIQFRPGQYVNAVRDDNGAQRDDRATMAEGKLDDAL